MTGLGKEHDAGFLAVFGFAMLIPTIITGMMAKTGGLSVAVPIGFFTLFVVLTGPVFIMLVKAIISVYIEVIKD